MKSADFSVPTNEMFELAVPIPEPSTRAQEIFKEALYAKDLRLKILKGKPGAGLHKNNSENNQNTGESNLEIHANEVEIGEKNNKKTEMAAGTKITSAVHANNTRKIGKILKISLRKGEKNLNMY